jgi:hypothetical protein
MAYYVFVTPDCKKDISTFNLESEVNKLIEKTIKEQCVSFFQNFPAPYLKKRFSRQERLIASIHSINSSEDTILIFHRILKRGDGDYAKFIETPREYGNRFFLPQIDDDVLTRWLEQERVVNQPKQKAALSLEEEKFIWHASSRGVDGYSPIESEYFIYESSAWYECYQAYKAKYGYETIKTILADQLTESELERDGLRNIQIHPSNNDYLVYRIFRNFKIVYLLGIFEKQNDSYLNLRTELNNILSNNDIQEHFLYRNSLKAYPYFLLVDDRWSEIQENKSTNLALSPEEKAVLFDVISFENASDKGFPLFLNGRAGSGKSTLLQYLFAEYLGTYLLIKDSFEFKPLYLSYSPQLIEIAETTIIDILRLGHRFEIAEKNIEALITEENKAFQTFSGFLKSMIPENDRCKFEDQNYINYSKFIQKWNLKYRNDTSIKSKVNADLCWHVIRTFIKGYNSDAYLDKEDYLELSRAKKSVSSAVFDLIYDRVWVSWYKDLTGSNLDNWDDLDLVRFILENNFVTPSYAAIFCDEAQDFTQIELDLLYKATIYSDRKLSLNELKRIPIAFAGDQFQTLNPTGFKWDSIRASYTEKFVEALVPWESKRNPTLHYRELRYNYRSQSKIVKVCNSLQAIRKLIFQIEDLAPQECWNIVDYDSPKLVVQEYGAGEYIKDNLGVRIIVPCNLGEEEGFFSQNGFLNDFAPNKDGFPLTVESAMRAKGQEYDEVIVFGFGAHYLEKGFPSIGEMLEIGSTPETLLEFEYFFNKLYVALSRARKKLFVVDTEEAKNNFWKYIYDKKTFDSILATINEDTEEWNNLCGLLVESSPKEMTESEVDLIQLANQKEEEGLKKQDYFILRQAGGLHSRNGNERRSNFSYGSAAEIQEEFKSAAEYFKECGESEKAFDNYWRAREYKALIDLAVSEKSLQLRMETKFAQLVTKPNVDIFQNVCANLNDYCKKPENKLLFSTDSRFKDILHETLENFIKNGNFILNQWDRIYTSLEVLENTRIYLPDILMARVAVRAEKYFQAVEIFEKNSDFSSKEYKTAKLILLENKLELEEYDDFTLREKDMAANFLLGKKIKFDLIAKFYLDIQRAEQRINYIKFEDLLRLAIKEKSKKVDEVARIYLRCHVLQSKYQRVFSLLKINTKRFDGHATIFSHFQENRFFWFSELVKEISISEELPKLIASSQAPVTEFLKQYFIDDSKEMDWEIHPLVVGAAFERAGQYIRSDQYYEKCLIPKEIEFGFLKEVAFRRIKIKSKLADRNKEIKNIDQYKKYLDQIEDLSKKFGIRPDDISEYPNVTQLLNWTPKPPPTIEIASIKGKEGNMGITTFPKVPNEFIPSDDDIKEPSVAIQDERILDEPSVLDGIFKIGEIKLIIDRKNGKVILRNESTNSDIRYVLNKTKWYVDADLKVLEIGSDQWRVQDWGVIYENSSSKILVLKFEVYGIEFSIRL